MLTGNKALLALDRSRKIEEIAEDLALMNVDTSDPSDVAALKYILQNLDDTATRLRDLTRPR